LLRRWGWHHVLSDRTTKGPARQGSGLNSVVTAA
jgi:hypothetical protein